MWSCSPNMRILNLPRFFVCRVFVIVSVAVVQLLEIARPPQGQREILAPYRGEKKPFYHFD